MKNFEDIEFIYKDKIYLITANKVIKAYRKFSPIYTTDLIVRMEAVIANELSIFTDIYVQHLFFAGLDVDETLEEIQDEVLVWAGSNHDNLQRLIKPMQEIKTCLTTPTASVIKKVGTKKPKAKLLKK